MQLISCRHLKLTPKSFRAAILLCMMPLLVSCAGRTMFSEDRFVAKPDNRFVLEKDGSHAAVWSTYELAVFYRYTYEADRLSISGNVKRRGPIRAFPSLRVRVRVHFLGDDGTILGSRLLWAGRGSDVYGQIRYDFRKAFQLPPGTSAIGFSHKGRAWERGTEWRFWSWP